jgi:hypothetical protein
MERAAAERPSCRARSLAAELRAAAGALITVIAAIELEQRSRVRKPGDWSPGKPAADAAARHLWHVCFALGVPRPDPPLIERARLTAVRTQAELAASVRACTETGARLIEELTDAQLELPAKPPRRPPRTVAEVVARPLIRHLATHRKQIELKLRASARSRGLGDAP